MSYQLYNIIWCDMILYIYIYGVYVCVYIYIIYYIVLWYATSKNRTMHNWISWFIVKFTLPYYNYLYTVHVKLAWILSYQSHHGWYYIHKFNWWLSRKQRWISTGDETIKALPGGRGAVFLGMCFLAWLFSCCSICSIKSSKIPG